MRFMFLFVCVLALVASVYTVPCYSNHCGGQSGGHGGVRGPPLPPGRGLGGRGGCPTCGLSNFGNRAHHDKKIPTKRHHG